MGLFDNIGSAQVLGNNNYLKPGEYWLQIVKLKIKPDRKHIPMFIGEFRVVKVLQGPPPRIDDVTGKMLPQVGHALGEEASHLVKTTSDYFLSEIKGIVVATLGIPADQVTSELCEEATGEANPFRGEVLHYQGIEIEGKESKPGARKYFTRRNYLGRVSAAKLYEGLAEPERVRFFGKDFDWKAAIEQEASAG